MATDEVLTLQEQFKELQGAVDRLSSAIDKQTASQRRTKRHVFLLYFVVVGMIVLSVFTVWFAITTRADLSNFGERLFVTSCEGRNQSREGNIADAEAALRITPEGSVDPVLAKAYLDAITENNRPEDCKAKLEIAR